MVSDGTDFSGGQVPDRQVCSEITRVADGLAHGTARTNMEQRLWGLVYISSNTDLEPNIMANEPELELTAELLKQCRNHAGWSQSELAKRAGLHETSVKLWEAKTGVIGGVAVNQMFRALAAELMSDEQPATPSDQRCGARTRKGSPCRSKPLPGKRRCKFHGGMSTGPKTPEGRERIAEAQRRRWAEYRRVA